MPTSDQEEEEDGAETAFLRASGLFELGLLFALDAVGHRAEWKKHRRRTSCIIEEEEASEESDPGWSVATLGPIISISSYLYRIMTASFPYPFPLIGEPIHVHHDCVTGGSQGRGVTSVNRKLEEA